MEGLNIVIIIETIHVTISICIF